ncbi:MAG: FG-GAP-like repeat-containing protein [bacterium]
MYRAISNLLGLLMGFLLVIFPFPAKASLDYKGICYGWGFQGQYSSTASTTSLGNLKNTNANYVGIIVIWYMDGTMSTTIYPDGTLTPSYEDVKKVIKDVHNEGMNVMLKIHLNVKHPDSTITWAGDIQPTDPNAWFDSYGSLTTYYARVAAGQNPVTGNSDPQNDGVELLCIGTELTSMTGTHTSEWNAIIDNIESIYTGSLTFCANYHIEYENLCFWDRMDIVGISVYSDLVGTSTPDPSLIQIIDAWSDSWNGHNWVQEFENWQSTVGKPVAFTEIGYCAVDYAAYKPWDGPRDYPYNGELQARCYKAAFEVFKDKDWFRGMFWWIWVNDPEAGTVSNPYRRDYTPQNKPAQNILTMYYTSYYIRGSVTTSTGFGIEDVTLTLSGDVSTSTTTSSNGSYEFTGLTVGTYTLVPTKSGYIFEPGSIICSLPPTQEDQNFVGTLSSAPMIISINPNTGTNIGTISTTIIGSNFQKWATATLTRIGEFDIVGSTTVENSGTITAIFDLEGKQHGTWSVVVTNPDGQSGTLTDGFTITRKRFTDSEISFSGGYLGDVDWGDFDNDGWIDLVLSGNAITPWIYRNNRGTFTYYQSLIKTDHGSLAWGDYDNDGDLDLALTGAMSGSATRIYKNENGTFNEDMNQSLIGVWDGDIAWADYDNDGDIDLVVAGDSDSGKISKIYRNDDGILNEDISQNLTGVGAFSSVAWADYDNDGDLDLALAGQSNSDIISKLYRNDNGTFTDTNQDLKGISYGEIAWGDFDNDGWLDLALTGKLPKTIVYRNINSILTEHQKLISLDDSSVAWGDYDNDGDMDLALAGQQGTITYLYRNDSGTFVNTNQLLPGGGLCPLTWVDYDNDGDIDLVLKNGNIKIYKNDEANLTGGNNPNGTPTSPYSLTAGTYASGKVDLGWGDGSDTETPAKGLYYNIRVGTTSGGNEIVSSKYGTPLFGNYYGLKTKSLTLKGLSPGTYTWSVQTIDTGLKASPWAEEQIFRIELKPEIVITKTARNVTRDTPFGTITDAISGDVVEFKIFLENVDLGTATDVIVTDTVPEGLTYIQNSISEGGDESELPDLRWEIGEIAPYGTEALGFKAKVD